MNPAEFFESRKIHIDEIDNSPGSSWLLWNSLPVGKRLVSFDGDRPVLLKSLSLVRRFFRESGADKLAEVIPLGPAEREVLDEHFQFDEYDNFEMFRSALMDHLRQLAGEMLKLT